MYASLLSLPPADRMVQNSVILLYSSLLFRGNPVWQLVLGNTGEMQE